MWSIIVFLTILQSGTTPGVQTHIQYGQFQTLAACQAQLSTAATLGPQFTTVYRSATCVKTN